MLLGGVHKFVWHSLEPKFHYADFATKSEILSGTQIMKVRNTNHDADFQDLCRRLSTRIVDLTDKIPLEQRKQVCRGLVTNFVANISTCRDGLRLRLSWFVSATFTETSWFHDLSPFVSTTFVICAHDFPRGKVSVKVGVMKFGLYTVNHGLTYTWRAVQQYRIL